ncbi:class II glutamine amidotransferase [Emcibacter nanhaiensis]|uniref:Class II glutamine amidotransferase n=1 Tax=Emcibacter nanhaiensis TaxID=1505037 RepID=A0A501PGE0_9PROT|nr:class II glutamine amidotransferase [Emcibacter nanhaiensis]TPD58946.1 class II glutamine amidotransferase [Emcibacter nanhaiensis]
MCRLYGFMATEPTKVECTLVHSQNALMAQSRSDLKGYSHSHGWGLAAYQNHIPETERQAWAAYHGEHFQRAATKVYAHTVIAHVRRATVGGAKLENTHPFCDGRWVFAHNGTVPNFDQVREKILLATAPEHRNQIKGETDSEHLFRYARTLIDREEKPEISRIVRKVVQDAESWALEIDPEARPGLNIILSNGEELAGSRLGRSLVFVVRSGLYDCEICGFPHIHHDPSKDYKAIIIASEPLTHEKWTEVPERSIWKAELEKPLLKITPLDP